MNCNQITELFVEYWDLAEGDSRRIMVDEHLLHCASCAEEFEMWAESSSLIQKAQINSDLSNNPIMSTRMSNNVMNRIYSDESWRVPVSERIYSLSYTMRRNLTVIISLCLTLFLC